jgi:hypothetical protein
VKGTTSIPSEFATGEIVRERPFWSVIVPLYERRQFLPHCLASVLDQDPGPQEMEICVVDDASPSDLESWVLSLGRGRLQYIRNANNLGLYPSKNEAIRRARGRWIHVLHDDDWVVPGFYETLRRGIESVSQPVGVAFCMYANWLAAQNSWWSPEPFAELPGILGHEFIVRLAQACPLNLPAVLFRRETFDEVGFFREDLPCTADWEWYVRSALKVSWYYQPETLACYRVHAENQSHVLARSAQNARDVRRTLELFAEYLPPDLLTEVLPAAQEFHGRQFFQTAHSCLRQGQDALGRMFALEALAIDPNGVARPEFAHILSHRSFAELRMKIRAIVLESERRESPEAERTPQEKPKV